MSFDSLVGEFAEEAMVILDGLEESLLSLEHKDLSLAGRNTALSSIRRGLHTLKGNAGMVGAGRIQAAVHVIEDVAASLSGGSAAAGSLLRACDVLREEMRAILEGRSVNEVGDALQEIAAGRIPGEEDEEQQAGDGVDLGGDLRVSQARLDDLVASAGDLLIHSARLQELVKTPQRDPTLLRDAADSLEGSLRTLHDLVLRIRTVPVGHLLTRFRRMVRDEAHRNGKEASLHIDGGDVEIDKAVLDHLASALGHVVRNAVVHGLETPGVRAAKGKSPGGTVSLIATAQGGQVEIQVRDDGAGIDREAILVKAQDLGLDTATREIDTLVFEPGVSTAELSASAGRGVGLEAVQRGIGRLGGSVEMESEEGKGTRFKLTVPTTIALQRSLLCSIGEEVYALPASNVIKALRLAKGQVRSLGGSSAVEFEGSLVPLVDSRGLFGAKEEGPFAVFVHAGSTVALRVDEFIGKQEFVFQPLDPGLCGDAPVDSAALMPDGKVVLRIDPDLLVYAATRREVNA